MNRTDEEGDRKAALISHTKRVVFVHGETGASKSELVQRAH